MKNRTCRIWKNVEGYEGRYLISNTGDVCGVKNDRMKMLSNNFVKHGYKFVTLCKNGSRKDVKVHKLVAIHFIPNVNNHPIINHKNGVKSCNYYKNLEWCNHSHNTKEAYRLGLLKKDTIPVEQYTLDEAFIARYDSIREASRIVGVCESNLAACVRGVRNKCGGFIWRKEETE